MKIDGKRKRKIKINTTTRKETTVEIVITAQREGVGGKEKRSEVSERREVSQSRHPLKNGWRTEHWPRGKWE